MTTTDNRTSDVPTVTDTVSSLGAPVTPRMRGRLHAWAVVVSVVTGIVLVTVAAATTSARAGWSTAVYALTIFALFTTSGLYHRRHWTPRGRVVMNALITR